MARAKAAPSRGRGRGRQAASPGTPRSAPTSSPRLQGSPHQPTQVRDGIVGPHNFQGQAGAPDVYVPPSRFAEAKNIPTSGGDGFRIFRSHFDNYRLLMPPREKPYRDNFDRLVWPQGREVKFTDHLCRTKDPEEIEYIMTSKAWNSGLIWDAEEERRGRLVEQFEAWKAEVLNDPKLLEELREQIGEEDYNLLQMLSQRREESEDEFEAEV